MKVWQLSVCLASERDIFNQYFPSSPIEDGRNEVNPSIVIAALSQSTTKLYTNCKGKWLRLYGADNGPIAQLYTLLEAYHKFGGDAITEVFDYGCVEI